MKGVSLIELILVIATAGILVLLIANFPNAIGLIGKAKHQSIAREIISKQVEELRVMPYVNLVSGQTNISDGRINQLPNGTATSLVEDCSVSICTNSEDTKQITVTVTWKEGGKPQTAELKTLISSGGLNK